MRYIAFFRGINVGGKNIVKMADLANMCRELGLSGVRTYIQSGNVVFESQQEERALSTQIQQSFLRVFGFESAVILRTLDEIADIIAGLPFTSAEQAEAQQASDAQSLYVYLFADAPPREQLRKLCAEYDGNDKLKIGKREIYLLCYQGVRNSKPAALLQKLALPCTARNWNTLNKLYIWMQELQLDS